MYISININATYQHITIVEQELKYARLLVEELQRADLISGIMDHTDQQMLREALRKAEALEAGISKKKRLLQEMADQMRYIQKRNQEDIEELRALVDQQLR